MRKRLAIAAVAFGLVLVPFALSDPPTSAQAMTCTGQEPINYACDAAFYVVGSVCQGKLPTKPPTPPIIATTSATIDLCPPLG